MSDFTRLVGRLSLLVALSLFLSILTRVSQSGPVQLPEGLRFAYQLQPDFNGDRPIVGRFGSNTIMNVSFTDAAGFDSKGRSVPVIINTASQEYALVIRGFPLRWLKTDQPVRGNLDEDEIDQIQRSSTYVYFHSGSGIISGMYAEQPQDNKSSEGYVYAAFICYLNAATSDLDKGVSYSFLPGANGPAANSLACAWRVSEDGNTAFGFEFAGSTGTRFVNGLPVSMDLKEGLFSRPQGYRDSSRAKKYLFWLKQPDNTYQSVVVDFSEDTETCGLLESGNASLLVNSSSGDVTTIAVNRVRTGDNSKKSVYVMGLIKLDASSGSTTWHRLPSTGTSQSIAMTSDGQRVLVAYESQYLYELPYSAVNTSFSQRVASAYELNGEARNYLLDKMLGDINDPDPASSGFGMQHLNGVPDSVFKGLLVSRFQSAMGYDDGQKTLAYPQISSLLALEPNQLPGDSDIPLSASQPAFTLGLENHQSEHVYYAAKDVRDGGDITTYYIATIPAKPELPPYRAPSSKEQESHFKFLSSQEPTRTGAAGNSSGQSSGHHREGGGSVGFQIFCCISPHITRD